MRNVTKSIPKRCFFEMTKKLKNGRGGLQSARSVLNRFGISQQKHLKSFHNKIMLLSSILKKISPTKRGWLFLDSTVTKNIHSLHRWRYTLLVIKELSNCLFHIEMEHGISNAPDYSIVEEGDNLRGIFKKDGEEMEVEVMKTYICPFMK